MKKTAVRQLSEYVATQGLRSTSQRDAILNAFIEAGQHLSADELYARVRKSHPRIGYATIYRTLKLLAEAGLAEERRFEDGFTRFEYKAPNAHHDHLICTRCGTIIEFENESIEALQQEVAGRKGFKVLSHTLEIYGICAGCQHQKQ